ncbi:MAG: primosomal protein N', partial [Coriobacteriales bacterium]
GYTPPGHARLQRSVLDALRAGPVLMSELRAELGPVTAAVKALQARGVVRVTSRRHWRGLKSGPAGASGVRHELTPAQDRALLRIRTVAAGSVVVLDGVTGSGKTEVYLRAIEEVLDAGGSALVLVPEISLTPHTVGRFRARFGDQVAVLHSRLSDGERRDQWDLAACGRARVVVGARSALFARIPGLRLIVIDEEHESSYKQGSAPRYHARDVACHVAATRGVTLVLGSATPSLETRERVLTGEWSHVPLPARVTAAPPPVVEVVDMGEEFKGGNRSMFSEALSCALDAVQDHARKAVLFLNRRGFASFLLCRECGFVPECPSCSVSLTYHEQGSVLRCHHCGHQEPAPRECPRCSSPYLRRFGAGTQRVEAELASRWPGLPVVRMDADTTSGKGGHERALMAFEALTSGVLLGTQMIAKGLDYPDIDLVGVMNADTTMHIPDFRATERTFQMLEQVAGRAGRGDVQGRVIIQTYWPDHPAVVAVAARDPGLLYRTERESRLELGYPPFKRLANIVLSGPDAQSLRAASARLATVLQEQIPSDWDVRGPADAPLSRIKNVYRRHVLVRAPAGAPIGVLLGDVLANFTAEPGVSVAPDVDPFDLL